MSNMIKIAGSVLEEVSLLDTRIQVSKPVIQAWARCFAAGKVYPTEALAAVHEHYGKPRAFPLLPGDVVAYCEAQPPWSSADHVSDFLDTWVQYPYSTTIADYSGIQPPAITPPESLSHDQERRWLSGEIQKWVDANRETLVAAILERRHKAVAQ